MIVDLAVETGGNCELTVPGEVVERHGVTIVGVRNLPATVPLHASELYAKNVLTLVKLFVRQGGQAVAPTSRTRCWPAACSRTAARCVHAPTAERSRKSREARHDRLAPGAPLALPQGGGADAVRRSSGCGCCCWPIFLGFELITKVPPTLHTPLMSGANAISGITLVGALYCAGARLPGASAQVLGFVAIVLATINVVGGFLVTDRMLGMFGRPKKTSPRRGLGHDALALFLAPRASQACGTVIELVYMVAALLFVLGIKRLSGVKTARAATASRRSACCWRSRRRWCCLWGDGGLVIVILSASLIGGGVGVVLAKRVPMTAMPEMVALFNGLGGARLDVRGLAEVSALRDLPTERRQRTATAPIGATVVTAARPSAGSTSRSRSCSRS